MNPPKTAQSAQMTPGQIEQARRHLTNQLITALRRGSEPWRPILHDTDLPDTGLNYGETIKFRVLGAGKPGRGDRTTYLLHLDLPPAILRTPDGLYPLTERRVTMPEAQYQLAVGRLQQEALACDRATSWWLEPDPLTVRAKAQAAAAPWQTIRGQSHEDEARTCCPWHRLLDSSHPPYRSASTGYRRNENTTRQQVAAARWMLRHASIHRVTPGRLRRATTPSHETLDSVLG